MERNVLNRAADYNKKRRKKVRRYKMFTVLAAVVVFCTTYSLIMPAITMETPQCGMEEHIHGDGCYEKTLICTQDENTEGHTHGDECYTVTTERELTCGKEECASVEGHTHSDSCYTVTQVPKYKTETVEHTEEGTDEEGNPITVTTTEEVQVEDGYDEVSELTCGYEEREAVEGHTHDDSCYTEVEHRELTCTEPETGHVHGEECYEKKLICELPEHTHDDSCYPEKNEDSEDVPPADGEDVPPADGEDVPPADGEDVPPVDGEEGEDVPPADGTETMKPVRVDEEGYILDENNNRVLDENGNPIKAEAVAPVEKPEEEQPEEVLPPEEQVGSAKVDADGYLLDENGERVLDENGNPILVEILDEEVPTGLMMTVLPAGAEIPENYTEHYSYADPEGEYAVTVHAPEGAVPADAELCATVMWGASTETEDGGVVPMDIHFEVEGHEIEPAMPVYVVINVEGLIPEDADHDSIEIHHYKGDEYNAEDAVAITAQAAGLVTDSEPMMMSLAEDEPEVAELPENVEVVANSEDNTGIVAVDAIADTTEMKAAFEVDSFSTFTITYYYNRGWDSKELKVYVVAENDPNFSVSVSNISNWYNTSKKSWTVDEIKNGAGVEDKYIINNTTYTFKGARADSVDGIPVTSVSCERSWGNYKWYYNDGYASLSTLYLVYEKKETTPETQNVYFYLLKPSDPNQDFVYNENLDGNTGDNNSKWLYMGRNQQVMSAPTNYNVSEGRKFERWDSGGEYTALEPDMGGIDAKQYYPDIVADGRTYTYDPDGAVGTYSIKWIRYTVATDYWTHDVIGHDNSNPGYHHYPDTYSWHIDGVMIKNKEQYVVTYALYDVDTKEIVLSDIGFTSTVKDGDKLKAFPGYSLYENAVNNMISGYQVIADDKWDWKNGTVNDGTVTLGNNYVLNQDPVTGNFTLYAPVKAIPVEYTLDLYKVAGTEDDEGLVTIEDNATPLGSAEFLLKDSEGKTMDTQITAESGSATIGHGHAIFTDLKAGTYTLTEIKAPGGYNQLAAPISITIGTDGTLTTTSPYAKVGAKNENTLHLTVANIGGYVLPSTGGEGTYWYTWSGAMLLMMAAAFTLMYKKSYRREGLED